MPWPPEPVHVTVAEPVALAPADAVAMTFDGAPGTLAATVWSENFSCSTLRSVSMPSLTFCRRRPHRSG